MARCAAEEHGLLSRWTAEKPSAALGADPAAVLANRGRSSGLGESLRRGRCDEASPSPRPARVCSRDRAGLGRRGATAERGRALKVHGVEKLRRRGTIRPPAPGVRRGFFTHPRLGRRHGGIALGVCSSSTATRLSPTVTSPTTTVVCSRSATIRPQPHSISTSPCSASPTATGTGSSGTVAVHPVRSSSGRSLTAMTTSGGSSIDGWDGWPIEWEAFVAHARSALQDRVRVAE